MGIIIIEMKAFRISLEVKNVVNEILDIVSFNIFRDLTSCDINSIIFDLQDKKIIKFHLGH